MNNTFVRYFIIGTFITLYLIVSVISTIHVIDFFQLSNPQWLAISLAVAFEIGAAASLASLIALDKMNRTLVWGLFITLTLMQMMGNTYYAFTNLENFQSWVELFGLIDEEPIAQKRILSLVSGAILPLVALGFIKSLVDYIRPATSTDEPSLPVKEEPLKEMPEIVEEKIEPIEEIVEEAIEEPIEKPIEEMAQEINTDELYDENQKRSILEATTDNPSELNDEILKHLESTGELTNEDIQHYREKSRIPERGKPSTSRFTNPFSA